MLNSPERPPQEVLDAGYSNEQMKDLRTQGRLQRFSRAIQLTNVNERRKVIENVPPAKWRGGCAPTSMAMLLMYYERLGYNIFSTNQGTNFVGNSHNIQLIASNRHYNDFYYPKDSDNKTKRDVIRIALDGRGMQKILRTLPDKSEDPHSLIETKWAKKSTYFWPDGHVEYGIYNDYFWDFARPDCVADILHTSFSFDGVTEGSTGGEALRRYIPPWIARNVAGVTLDADFFYTGVIEGTTKDYDEWEVYKSEIDAGRPTLLSVDSSGKGYPDHLVTGIGYEELENGTKMYACYNTWGTNVRWYKWISTWGNKQAFSVGDMFTFSFSREDVTADLFEPNWLYRFYRPTTGAYFFTSNPVEVAAVENELSHEWKYQGPVFVTEGAPTAYNTPVYRFYNKKAAAHLYTIDESERANVAKNMQEHFEYDGVAFFAHPNQQAGDAPVYRFYLLKTSSHFFTNSETEKNYLIENGDPEYIRFEGVAWYAPRVHLNGRVVH